MLDDSQRASFAEQGCVVLRCFEDAARCSELRAICDRVLEGILSESEGRARFENGPNIAYLTDPAHHGSDDAGLGALLEAVGDARAPRRTRDVIYAAGAPVSRAPVEMRCLPEVGARARLGPAGRTLVQDKLRGQAGLAALTTGAPR